MLPRYRSPRGNLSGAPSSNNSSNFLQYAKSRKHKTQSSQEGWILKILACNVICFVGLVAFGYWYVSASSSKGTTSTADSNKTPRDLKTTTSIEGKEQVWHGGQPHAEHKGSCWCAHGDNESKQDCVCTPSAAVNLILVTEDTTGKSIWLLGEKDTQDEPLATPGSFVGLEETVEQAVHRTIQEAFGVEFSGNIQLLGVYSDPKRDTHQQRTLSMAYVIHLTEAEMNPESMAKAAAIASSVQKEWIPLNLEDIDYCPFVSDHKTMLLDYRQSLTPEKGPATVKTLLEGSKHDRDARAALYVGRSVCSVHTGETSWIKDEDKEKEYALYSATIMNRLP